MADPNKKSQTTPDAKAAPAGVEPLKKAPVKSKRGGARPNAGRRPDGLRPEANKISRKREAAIAATGLTPLEYMLKVMRDPKQKRDRRDWAAEKAAPYVHPRLAAVEQVGDPLKPRSMDEVKDARAKLAGRIAGITKRKGTSESPITTH